MAPIALDYLALPVVAALGAWVSWRDIQEQRIPNAAIRLGVYAGLVWTAVLIGVHTFGAGQGFLRYGAYPDALAAGLNVALGWLVGYGLWHFDLWSAGDGKLFGVLCMLVSPGICQRTYVPYFPGFSLLLNTFLCVFLIILLEFLWNAVRSLAQEATSRESWRRVTLALRANWSTYLSIAVTFLVMLLFVMRTRSFLRQEMGAYLATDEITLYLLLFLLYRPLKAMTQRWWFMAGIYGLFAGWLGHSLYLVQTSPEHTYGRLASEVFHLSGVMIFIIAFSIVYHVLSPLFFQEQLPARKLRPGMVLGETTIARLEEDADYSERFSPHVGHLRHTALTAAQLDEIREWYAHQQDRSPFFVERHVPFAPGLVAGALLTFWAQGPLMEL